MSYLTRTYIHIMIQNYRKLILCKNGFVHGIGEDQKFKTFVLDVNNARADVNLFIVHNLN